MIEGRYWTEHWGYREGPGRLSALKEVNIPQHPSHPCQRFARQQHFLHVLRTLASGPCPVFEPLRCWDTRYLRRPLWFLNFLIQGWISVLPAPPPQYKYRFLPSEGPVALVPLAHTLGTWFPDLTHPRYCLTIGHYLPESMASRMCSRGVEGGRSVLPTETQVPPPHG